MTGTDAVKTMAVIGNSSLHRPLAAPAASSARALPRHASHPKDDAFLMILWHIWQTKLLGTRVP